MTWDRGWNFRATSAFVTDGTNETYSLGEVYPTTRNGVTFGFGSDLSANARDRNAVLDRRLAGLNFKANDGTQVIFQVDLPGTGLYNISLAMGDDAANHTFLYVQVRDGVTGLLTVSNAGMAMSAWEDTTGTAYSAANWPGSNAPASLTFTGTTLNLALGSPTLQADNSVLAHLFVSQVSSNAPGPFYVPTKRPAKSKGPYDAKGFLLSPLNRYSFVPSVVPVSNPRFRRPIHPFGTASGKRTKNN